MVWKRHSLILFFYYFKVQRSKGKHIKVKRSYFRPDCTTTLTGSSLKKKFFICKSDLSHDKNLQRNNELDLDLDVIRFQITAHSYLAMVIYVFNSVFLTMFLQWHSAITIWSIYFIDILMAVIVSLNLRNQWRHFCYRNYKNCLKKTVDESVWNCLQK